MKSLLPKKVLTTNLTALALLLFCTSDVIAARIVTLRDTIGPDSSTTDGVPGAESFNAGEHGHHPGAVFHATDSGVLKDVSFVIFARDTTGSVVNDPKRIQDEVHLTFHLWKDGVLGVGDTFESNPQGDSLSGLHTRYTVNDPNGITGLMSVEAIGRTGQRDPNEYTTFRVTIDLTGFSIPVQSSNEYVSSLIYDYDSMPDRPIAFLTSGSTIELDQEDLWYTTDLPWIVSPGYLKTQLFAPFRNYAYKFRMLALEGDFNKDGRVDGHDFLTWQASHGDSGNAPYTNGDADGDGDTDCNDLTIWESQYGMTIADLTTFDSVVATTVPEPSSFLMQLACACLCFKRHRRVAQVGASLPGFQSDTSIKIGTDSLL